MRCKSFEILLQRIFQGKGCSMKKKSLMKSRNFIGYLFILPACCTLLVFVIFPLIASLVSSLFDFDIMLSRFDYIGCRNYRIVLETDRFWNSLKNTAYFSLAVVPLQNLLSLLVAVGVCKVSRINEVLRTIYFLPVVCSMTVIALSFGMIFNYNIGIVPAILKSWGIKVPDLLNSTAWAMPTVIFISIYKSFGFNMVIFIAALQAVPEQLYEAAEIDGATKIKSFFNITIPSIAPTIAFTIITSIIGSFQVFDQVYVTTKGGPLFRTETIVQFIYERAFKTLEMGIATAAAFLLFIIILTATIISFKISQRSEVNY
jgi:multiple sugar transport system permease protein